MLLLFALQWTDGNSGYYNFSQYVNIVLDGNVCDQPSVLSITFTQAVKLFSIFSTIPMTETITNSATGVAVPKSMQYQEHLRDFENIVYFAPQNFEKWLLAASCLSVYLPVRMEQLVSHRMDFC